MKMKIEKPGLKPILFPIWISLCTGLLAGVFLIQSFADSTQGTYAAMASGLLGSSSASLPGQSYLLGKGFRFLYARFPAVSWYTLFLFGIGAVTPAVIGTVLLYNEASAKTDETRARADALLLCQVVLNGYFTISLMGNLSTLTAGCAAAVAGILLLFAACLWEKGRIAAGILGALACLAGGLLSPVLFLICAAVMSAALIFRILFLMPEKPRRLLSSFLLLDLPVLLLASAAILIDARAVNMDGEAAHYQAQAAMAQKLQEYGLPAYYDHEDVYKELGITRNTWTYFENTGNYDFSVLDTEQMEKLLKLQKHSVFQLSSWTDFLRVIARASDKEWYFGGALTIFLLWLLLHVRGRRRAAVVLVPLALLFFLGGIAWCAQLLPGAGCAAGLWLLTAAVFMNGLSSGGAVSVSRTGMRMGFTAVIILCMFFWRGNLKIRNNFQYYRWKTNYDILGSFRADPEHSYLRGGGVLSYQNCLDPWRGNITPLAGNTAFMGMQDLSASDREWIRQKYQVENPWTDMVDNEKVYLIDDEIEDTLKYLRKQYHKKAEAIAVGTLDDRTVYRIESKK